MQSALAATVIVPKWWERWVLRKFNAKVADIANQEGVPVEDRRKLRADLAAAAILRDGHWFALHASVAAVLLVGSLPVPILILLPVFAVIIHLLSAPGDAFMGAAVMVSKWMSGQPIEVSPQVQASLDESGFNWGAIRFGCFGLIGILGAALAFALALLAISKDVFLLFPVVAWADGVRRHQRAVIIALSDGTESTETQTAFSLNPGQL